MSCGPISSPDTMAAMLLCARLGKASEQKVKPLSLGEYNRFAAWLKDNSLRPSSLLTQDGIFHVRNYRDSSLEPDRLEALLKRGGSLAFHLEKWGQAGIWVIGRGETEYPQLLKKRLRTNAAPFIFGVGNRGLLNIGGVCIVGSRDVSAGGIDFARQLGRACAADRLPVISGNAKGADSESMISSYNANGAVIGVLAENLLKTALNGKYRAPLQSGRMVLFSPFSPETHFSIGNAMARNKYLYGLSNFAVIVESGLKGGTWEGALENLKNGWVKSFIRSGNPIPKGNEELARRGIETVNSVSEINLISMLNESTQEPMEGNRGNLNFNFNI